MINQLISLSIQTVISNVNQLIDNKKLNQSGILRRSSKVPSSTGILDKSLKVEKWVLS